MFHSFCELWMHASLGGGDRGVARDGQMENPKTLSGGISWQRKDRKVQKRCCRWRKDAPYSETLLASLSQVSGISVCTFTTQIFSRRCFYCIYELFLGKALWDNKFDSWQWWEGKQHFSQNVTLPWNAAWAAALKDGVAGFTWVCF